MIKNTAKAVVCLVAILLVLSVNLSVLAIDYIGVGTITGNGVNVRTGAGINNPVITQAYAGGKVKVIENNQGWAKVQLADGSVGYISADYINVTDFANHTGYITGSIVNIREGIGTDYKVIGTVSFGQSVTITGENTGWFHIIYNGMNGYVCGEYVSMEKQQQLDKASSLITEAKTHLGKPYVYGGSGPYSFDCSGFTSYVYRKLGYELNRTAAGQYSNGVWVSRDQLMPGDLVMFGNSYINHVGIYVGNNSFIHAENGRTGVTITSLDAAYYNTRYVGARRII